MTVQLAKEIRVFIKKEFGLNSRQVSVKTRDLSISTAVDVNVKKVGLGVDLEQLKNKVEQFSHIRICEVSRDLLGGGNRFVRVTFDSAEFDELRSRFRVAAKGFHYGGKLQVGGFVVETDHGSLKSFNIYRDGEFFTAAYGLHSVFRVMAEHFGQFTQEEIESALESVEVSALTLEEVAEKVERGSWKPAYLRCVMEEAV